jgi:hypothetical protein
MDPLPAEKDEHMDINGARAQACYTVAQSHLK